MTTQTITLGGGCFWCTEAVFVRVRGVLDVESGYCNGLQARQPSYEDVCRGDTGYNEVVRVQYDPAIISLPDLLTIFCSIHDPTSLNRQGNDVGTQYRSALFYKDEEQKALFENAIERASEHWGGGVVTTLEPLTKFWVAEDYHQDYFDKNVPNKTGNYRYCQSSTIPKLKKLGLLKDGDQ